MKAGKWVVSVVAALAFVGSAYAQAEKGAAEKKVDVPKAEKKAPAKPAPKAEVKKPAAKKAPAKAEAKKSAKKAEPKAEAKAASAKATLPEEGVPGGITLGVLSGESDALGYGDILAPLYYNDTGLLFFNPRYSQTDDDAEEINLGLGYRQLMTVDGSEFIVGGNVYYDHRETTHNNEFDQFGVGVEFMSKWVDARANLYMADDDEELVDREEENLTSSSTKKYWSPIYGEGNSLKQDWLKRTTTTRIRRLFEQYEAAMDGFDAEIGVKIPELSDLAPTRVFVGYQSFDNPYGDDLDGMTARLEVRPMPGVTLDAQYFEEEALNGTDYYVGGRVRVPFDVQNVVNGKNPFEGAEDAFKRAEEGPLSDRMTEMVMRDMKVQVSVSDYMKVAESINTTVRVVKQWDAVVTDQVTNIKMDGLAFVNADNDWDWHENGSYENPYNRIGEGVLKAWWRDDIDIVYVMAANETYRETTYIPADVTVWGAGEPIFGYGGHVFGGEEYPLVDALSKGPTFRMDSDSTLKGVEIQNSLRPLRLAHAALQPWNWAEVNDTVYFAGRAGIYARNETGVLIENVKVHNTSYGALILADEADLGVEINRSSFSMNANGGVRIDGEGGSGDFRVEMDDNRFALNLGVVEDIVPYWGFQEGGHGLFVRAQNYDSAYASIDNTLAYLNRQDGVHIEFNNIGSGLEEDTAQVNLYHVDAFLNGLGVPPWENIPRGYGHLFASGDGVNISVTTTNGATGLINTGNILAWGNSDDGIEHRSVALDGGTVQISSWGLTSKLNYDQGIILNTMTTNGTGTSDIWLQDGTALLNGLAGGGPAIEIGALNYGSGRTYVDIDDLRAVANNGAGADVGADQMGVGLSTVDLSGGMFALNNGYGLSTWATAADGPARVSVKNGVSAIANADFGVMASATASNNLADLKILDTVVMANGGFGAMGWATSDGALLDDANVNFSGVDALFNGDFGLMGWATSLNGDAGVRMMDVNAVGNSSFGVMGWSTAGGLDAHAYFQRVNASLNGSFGLQGWATADGREADLDMIDILSVGNADFGVQGWAESDGFWGASANFEGVKTLFNDGHGLDGLARASHPGVDADAELDMTDVLAVGNTSYGVQGWASSSNGVSDAYLSGITPLFNGSFGVQGFATSQNGAANLEMYDVLSAGNVLFGAMGFSTSGSGTSDAYLSGITTLFNGMFGVQGFATSASGPADLEMYDVLSAGNVLFGAMGFSTSGDSRADTYLSGITTLFNGDFGVQGFAAAEGLWANLEMVDVLSAGNAGDGVLGFATSSNSWADATFSGVTTLFNQGYGLQGWAESETSWSHLELSSVLSAFNDAGGIYGSATAVDGSARVSGTELASFKNGFGTGQDGIHLAATSVTAAATVELTSAAAGWNAGMGIVGKANSSNGTASVAMNDLLSIGHDNWGVWGDALSVNGPASASVDGAVSLLNNNWGITLDANSTVGDVSATVANAFSAGNDNYGIRARVYSSNGTATVTSYDSIAALNNNYGFTFTADSQTGSALVDLDRLVAVGNANSGIDVSVVAGAWGLSTLNVDDTILAGNGGDGLAASVTGESGFSKANINNVWAFLNTDDGLDVFVDSPSGDSSADYMNVYAFLNGDNGIESEVASFIDTPSFDNVVAAFNGGNGIHSTVTANWTAMSSFNNIVAIGNGGAGINSTVTATNAGGYAEDRFNNIITGWNGGDGIASSVFGPGSANLYVDNVVSVRNGDDGLHLNVQGTSGSAYAHLGTILSAGNDEDGVDLTVNSVDGSSSAEIIGAVLVRNGENGFLADIHSASNDASAVFSYVAALANGYGSGDGDGFHVDVHSDVAASSLSFSWAGAAFNAGDGFDTSVGSGTGTVSYVNAFSLWNGGNGIADSVAPGVGDSEAIATYLNVVAAANSLSGILSELDATDVSWDFNNVAAFLNGADGVGMVDLGCACGVTNSLSDVFSFWNGGTDIVYP